MRPLPGDDADRSRRPSLSQATPMAQPQMTYFLADEKTMEASALNPAPRQRESVKGHVIAENTEPIMSSPEPDVGKARHNWKNNLMQQMSAESDDGTTRSRSSSPHYSDLSRNASPSHERHPSQTNLSRPFTPSIFESPAPGSVVSSPRSRRESDAGSFMDDIASQAIMSSGEEGEQDPPAMMDSGSAPQLVMPSIKMPSRRPFTDRGKNMGRLKVLIAGDSGIGKTSLIKAIVQTCEDIVHVDPISLPPISISPRRKSSKSRARSADLTNTAQITEVYASTRAYPAWWSDLDDGRVLRRRKSMGDSVLERNLCFVDTPGYGSATSCLETLNPVIDYVECQIRKVLTTELPESDVINMLSGSGGSQVDVVFYIIKQDIKPVDIEYLRRLAPLTNIIPVIGHADKLSQDQILALKSTIRSELGAVGIRPFYFGVSPDSTEHATAPWAVSTANARDMETMDASLLMSPDYVQPLVSSELAVLVDQVFDQDNISWLRHSAAKKIIQWKNASSSTDRPQDLYRPLSLGSSVVSSQLTATTCATTSYALARITDHTQREERLAQIRLSNWAADLQRSIKNEQLRFEQVARNERAFWLTERLGECVQDGTIVPLSQARQMSFPGDSSALTKRDGRRHDKHYGSLDPHDPLGLLQLNADLKKRGILTLQVVSSFGIIGGLAFWISRGWQSGNGSLSWGVNWSEYCLIDW
ncbi:hypothetical protein BP6252_07610 [Coleophoma cylindrospora]|uniref:Septin-type G domain-containing protein n=1 Tax=Coleophoma cylindrospora TaxID=1849047 RepID=A0A3D8RAH0_9HELO|nr:hypothetical protein BP6252_07610 [Coleophoma cylindrospora]